ISDQAWADFQDKQQRLEAIKQLLEKTKVTTAVLAKIRYSERSEAQPNSFEGPDVSALGQTLAQLLKRPEITIEALTPALRDLAPEFLERELKSIETEIKYEGYLLQQQRAIDRLKKAEQRAIPEWFDYHSVSGLSKEMQETLLKIRPRTLAHASRIPGVTPAAVSLVHVYIEIQARRRQEGPCAF